MLISGQFMEIRIDHERSGAVGLKAGWRVQATLLVVK